jgi:hypothetical protein
MEAGQGTLPAGFSGLNVWGAITGVYYDANNGFHGYLRTPEGNFITFEAPGADITIPFNGTFPNSINDAGGYYRRRLRHQRSKSWVGACRGRKVHDV